MKNVIIALAVGLGLAWNAAAQQLSIISGWDSNANVSTAPVLQLSDFVNNPSGYWTAMLGTNTSGGNSKWQGGYSGPAEWVAGANNFTLTYNPSTGLETYTADNSSGEQTLSYTAAFNAPINYIQFNPVARKGTGAQDGFSVTGLTLTSLDGSSTYLSNGSVSVGNNGGYLNYQINDTSGVLANGFILSGILNLSAPANYNANQTDKFVVTTGNDPSFSPSPSPSPEPSTLALGLASLLPLGAALRRKLPRK